MAKRDREELRGRRSKERRGKGCVFVADSVPAQGFERRQTVKVVTKVPPTPNRQEQT
jgi:hypothetical protein